MELTKESQKKLVEMSKRFQTTLQSEPLESGHVKWVCKIHIKTENYNKVVTSHDAGAITVNASHAVSKCYERFVKFDKSKWYKIDITNYVSNFLDSLEYNKVSLIDAIVTIDEYTNKKKCIIKYTSCSKNIFIEPHHVKKIKIKVGIHDEIYSIVLSKLKSINFNLLANEYNFKGQFHLDEIEWKIAKKINHEL